MFFNQDGWFWDILVSDGSILQKKKKKLKNLKTLLISQE